MGVAGLLPSVISWLEQDNYKTYILKPNFLKVTFFICLALNKPYGSFLRKLNFIFTIGKPLFLDLSFNKGLIGPMKHPWFLELGVFQTQPELWWVQRLANKGPTLWYVFFWIPVEMTLPETKQRVYIWNIDAWKMTFSSMRKLSFRCELLVFRERERVIRSLQNGSSLSTISKRTVVCAQTPTEHKFHHSVF